MKLIKISEQNLKALETIQDAIKFEENKDSSYDEIIKRILMFYSTKINFG
ncbi:hypothetical protein JW865_04080 [Candidatus Bathyarchaeota archaeon]|nr:hypothetical protein [Candidatus Bathyarchaeota archaeon]